MSPTIKIPKHTLDKVKSKQGIYSKLRADSVITSKEEKQIKESLTEAITGIIKSAFMDYAIKGHKADRKLAELEWTRFHKFLKKKL